MNDYRTNARETHDVTAASAEGESPEVIRADIATTRDEMSGTIDAIQEKLNPDRLKEQVSEAVQEQIAQVTEAVQEQIATVKANIREATVGRAEQMVSNVSDSAKNASSGLIGTIKENPIPAAMAALGLGWLWMRRSNGSSNDRSRDGYAGNREYYANGQPYYGQGTPYGARGYGYGYESGRGPYGYGPTGYYDRSGENDQSLGDRVGDVTGQANDKVGDVTGQAKDRGQCAGRHRIRSDSSPIRRKSRSASGADRRRTGRPVSRQVQYGAQHAKSRFDRTLYENPLAVSAAAIAPRPRGRHVAAGYPVEDRLMGEARDNVMEKAQAAAQDTLQKVGQVAQQVQQSAKDAAQQVQQTAKDEAQKQGLTQPSQPSSGQQSQQGTAQNASPQPARQTASASTPRQTQQTGSQVSPQQGQQSTASAASRQQGQQTPPPASRQQGSPGYSAADEVTDFLSISPTSRSRGRGYFSEDSYRRLGGGFRVALRLRGGLRTRETMRFIPEARLPRRFGASERRKTEVHDEENERSRLRTNPTIHGSG